MPKYYKLNNSTIMYLNTSFGCVKTNSITATLTSAGTGYTSAPTVNIKSSDAGSGCAITALLTATTVSSTYTIVSGGTGYVVGDALVFNNTGTGGSGVAATVSTVSAGVITAITFSSQGTGYNIKAPTLTTITSSAGVGANITFKLTAVPIGSISTTNYGANYSTLPTITFSGSNLPTSISGYSGFTGGTGYALPPTLTISNAGSGTGFTAYTTLTPTTVSTSYTIVSGGKGYLVNNIIVFDNTGTGGSGVAAKVLTVDANTGAILTITFTSPGSGYTTKAPVMTTISSTAGSGALITFSLTPTSVGAITITNQGIGYTSPSFVFTPVSGGSGASETPTIVAGTQAVITPSFYKTFTYTWKGIPQLNINDLGKLSAINIIANGFNTSTPYTYRILGLQYDSRDSFFSDYGQPILSMAQNINVCSIGSLGGNSFCIILTPQTISSITISVDDDITTKGSGQSANINFVIALQIEEYDPNYTEVGDVYAESASRLKLNY